MATSLQFMTSYDPHGTSEGTLDPLGLYQIADQLAVQLVPAPPLFRAAIGTTGRLVATAIHVDDICRIRKRRLKDASMPSRLSPLSFRVAVITDLLEQGVPLEDVQHLVGHPDPRTTRLYDRRQRKVT